MQLSKKTDRTYWWEGTFFEPSESKDADPVESRVKLKFKRILDDSDLTIDATGLKGIIVDWDNVFDASSGEAIPFTEAALSEALKDPFVVANFQRIYFDAFRRARQGN